MKQIVFSIITALSISTFALPKYMLLSLNGKCEPTYHDTIPDDGFGDGSQTNSILFTSIEPASCTAEITGFPPRTITITKPFWISVTEINQGQYTKIMGNNPSATPQDPLAPVNTISYSNIRGTDSSYPNSSAVSRNSFLHKLRTQSGIDTIDIPTEGEWRLAATSPNVQNMQDNFHEICRDYYRPYLPQGTTPLIDPKGHLPSEQYPNRLTMHSSSKRAQISPQTKHPKTGFRLVIEETQPPAPPKSAPTQNQTYNPTTPNYRLTITLTNSTIATLHITYQDGTHERIWIEPREQIDNHRWLAYRYRVHAKEPIPFTTYDKTRVKFSTENGAKWLGFDVAILPYFHDWDGIYDHSEVLKQIQSWQENYPSIEERQFNLDFYYDTEDNLVKLWLDGSYAGTGRVNSPIEQIRVEGNVASSLSKIEPQDPNTLKLAPQPNPLRVHPYLRKNANLTIPTGNTTISGIPINVWKPEESFDQGLHRETCHKDDIMMLGQLCRTAFANGPEYLQWSIPCRTWSDAYILCASIPNGAGGNNAKPLIGTELGRYVGGEGNTAWFTTDTTTIPQSPTTNTPEQKIVGEVEYTTPDGHRQSAPLLLVHHKIDVGEILSLANEPLSTHKFCRNLGHVRHYLDFAFTGGGNWDGCPKSNVQIFGCTLLSAPATMEVLQSTRGNIFAQNDKPETQIRITSLSDNLNAKLKWTIRDTNYKEIKTGEFPISLPQKGTQHTYTLPLNNYPLGWYALDWSLIGANGQTYLTHEASFTLLGPDTREAGFDSPYGGWPQQLDYNEQLAKEKPETKGFAGGRLNCNPDRLEVLKMLHKLGFHKSAHQIVYDENEFPEYQFTLCDMGLYSPPAFSKICSEEKMQEQFTNAINQYRKTKKRYPHLNTYWIFHEDDPRGLSKEILGEQPVKIAEANTPLGKWQIHVLTEFCKRLKSEFPGIKIRIANNSAAGERVANLARKGFDLNLIDELGSEVRGFQSIPEAPTGLDAPGTIWALKATGKLFGMTNVQAGASFEYVFRPERRVNRQDPDNLRQTNYAVRDYLITLAHGCPYITSGHLEDCWNSYYDTDWGASGLCRAYPTSYPKRMFTAIATLTRILDKPTFRRRIPTGENTAYALEFARNRKTPDLVYALWTPDYEVELKLNFSTSAKVQLVDTFGATKPYNKNSTLTIGPSPIYLISNEQIQSAKVVRDIIKEKDLLISNKNSDYKKVTDLTFGTNIREVRHNMPSYEYGVPGNFAISNTTDKIIGPSLSLTLLPTGPNRSPVLSEYTYLEFDKPKLTLTPTSNIGIWVNGNGSFGKIGLVFQKRRGETEAPKTHIVWPGTDGYINFHGWQFLTARAFSFDTRTDTDSYRLVGIIASSARRALDPINMTKITKPLLLGPIYHLPTTSFTPDYNAIWSYERLRGPLAGWL